MREAMRATSADEAGMHVVTVTGEVDMDSSPQLLAEIQTGIRHGHPVVVDLGGVPYIDSSGIAVLVQGLKAAMKRGTTFRLRNPSGQVVAVLRLAQLLQLFGVDAPDGDKRGGDKSQGPPR